MKIKFRNCANSVYCKITFPVLFLILFSACEDKDVIPEDKFIKVYVDLMVIQDTTGVSQVSADSIKAIVFKRYNITDADYNNTLDYYNDSPEKWDSFFKKAIAYVEELKSKADD